MKESVNTINNMAIMSVTLALSLRVSCPLEYRACSTLIVYTPLQISGEESRLGPGTPEFDPGWRQNKFLVVQLFDWSAVVALIDESNLCCQRLSGWRVKSSPPERTVRGSSPVRDPGFDEIFWLAARA